MSSGYSYTEFHNSEYFIPFIKERLERNEAIEFTEPNDIAFAQIAQKSLVTGTTMPSGLKIPTCGKLWRIINNYAIMDYGY
tara:strand:- start:1104 stop:1346 length:243 start_codon:yes stop_codon:yes gene_type:complete